MLANFEMKQGVEKLTTHSGLSLIGLLLNKTNIKQLVNCLGNKPRNPGASNSDIIFAMVGLISMAKPHFDAIEPFRQDIFFTESLGLFPAPPVQPYDNGLMLSGIWA